MADDDGFSDQPDDDDDEGETFEEFYAAQREACRHQVPDIVLTSLVMMVNRHGTGQVPITVMCGGTVISGLMVSIQRWHADAGEWASRQVGDGAPDWAEWLKDQAIAHEMYEAVKAADESAPRPRHLHLLSATVFEGVRPSIIRDAPWRARLSAVDGWTLGLWSYDAQKEAQPDR